MHQYDIVMDGTTLSLNDRSTACIAQAGCHGINLNGFGEEYKYDGQFKGHGKTHVPGFGMTPGITDMMVKYAADQLETVDIVRVSHGAFRPIAFSAAIAETTTYEYDPNLLSRVVYEDGKFIRVPPFARPRNIELPEPYGTHPEDISLTRRPKPLPNILPTKESN
jgi:saccharopine dehydrogenase-like NADP-dependent oxidoreductase